MWLGLINVLEIGDEVLAYLLRIMTSFTQGEPDIRNKFFRRWLRVKMWRKKKHIL